MIKMLSTDIYKIIDDYAGTKIKIKNKKNKIKSIKYLCNKCGKYKDFDNIKREDWDDSDESDDDSDDDSDDESDNKKKSSTYYSCVKKCKELSFCHPDYISTTDFYLNNKYGYKWRKKHIRMFKSRYEIYTKPKRYKI
ncbi:MAG: hypothetical protein ACW99G_20410 [Candidatus Thorarchaeota archaeon]|jgi:hypothetical protein